MGPIGVLAVGYHIALRRERHRIFSVALGVALAFVGLTLFLAGVRVAFIPAGEVVSSVLAARNAWLLVPIGFVLGSVAAFAEPAVRVMRDQVERVSSGSINGNLVVGAIAVGVGTVVAVAIARVILDFPLWWILLPGYIAVFLLAPFSDRRFVGMAFDSGGIATGPMAVTFVLSLAIGAAEALPGRNPETLAFGMVGLIALAPILTVLALGVAYRQPQPDRKKESRS